MSLLLKALSKHAEGKERVIHPMPRRAGSEQSISMRFWLICLCVAVVLGLCGLYAVRPSEAMAQVEPEPAGIEAPKPLETLAEMARTHPDKILARLHTAPESLQPERDELMRALLDHQSWPLAYRLSRALPSDHPSLEERKMLAVYALEEEHYEQACHHYQSMAEEKPDQTETWLGLGICSMKLGHYRQAMRAYERAIEQMSEEHVAYTFVLEQLDRLSEGPWLHSEGP